MSLPLDFLRGLIGLLGVGCAFLLAQTVVGLRKGRAKIGSLYAWLIRTGLCLAAVAFRHSVDTEDLAIWTLVAVAFAVGYWEAAREKKAEDLTRTIFPE
jgi:hypothetical protein